MSLQLPRWISIVGAGIWITIQAIITIAPELAFASYCDSIVPPVPPCPENSPRDLLFVLDGSQSINRDKFFGEMLDYALSLFCAFDQTKSNQAGAIVFNEQIKTYIPLAQYTQDQWHTQVETIRATKNSENSACCTCCTPTAEAFDAAGAEFTARGINKLRIAFMITDGVPSNNFPNTGGNPLWWYNGPVVGLSPAVYNMRIVPDRANALKAQGVRIFLVGVPDRDGHPPDQQYFSGGFASGTLQCIKRDMKQFCYKYNKPPFPIVSLPVNKNSFSTQTWDVKQLIQQTVGALCELPPTFVPSQTPTDAPSASPTKLPTSQMPSTAPTKPPSSTMPSFSPTILPTTVLPSRTPTRRPTFYPTSRGPTFAPTDSPSTTPTSSPSLSPTSLPTSQAPSSAPVSQSPTLTPTLLPTVKPTRFPTRRPTSVAPSRHPTSRPTVSPTPAPFKPSLEQVDLTFLVDRSQSMRWHDAVCALTVNTLPPMGGKRSTSQCWELFMRYILAQVDEISHVQVVADGNATKDVQTRDLGWASEFPGSSGPAKGIRVNIIGFSCANKQRTPRVFQYTRDIAGGPVSSRDSLLHVLDQLRTTVLPDGGTCPGLAIEQAVRQIESTSEQDYPLQTVILMTDGIFYDDPFPENAVAGLKAYKALRFAVGIAVADSQFSYGLSPDEVRQQRIQLGGFVGDGNLFKPTDGWSALPIIAKRIAQDLPTYYYQGVPIPRYTWCGWRRIASCQSDNWRRECVRGLKRVTSSGMCSKGRQ